jgi:hypothetical protein
VRAKRGVQLVQHDARLDPRPPFGGVQLEEPIEVFRRIDLKARADGLAGLRRAAASRGDRDAVPPRDLDNANDVLTRSGNDDAERLDLIDARVGGVERARDPIEPDFARYRLFEIALKGSDVQGGSL